MSSHLVNEDPVSCCIVFNNLIDVIMNMLQIGNVLVNLFERFRVTSAVLMRIFYCGLLVHRIMRSSVNMQNTVRLVHHLGSVSTNDVLNDAQYSNQTQRYTFTCTKGRHDDKKVEGFTVEARPDRASVRFFLIGQRTVRLSSTNRLRTGNINSFIVYYVVRRATHFLEFLK